MLKRVEQMRGAEFDALEPAERPGSDLRGVLNFLWRRWRFIGGDAALALLIGALYVALQTPLYTATAQLLLDPPKEKIAQDVVLAYTAIDSPAVESQIAVIRSASLLRRVVEKEALVNDPEFGAVTTRNGWLDAVRRLYSPSPALADAAKAQTEGLGADNRELQVVTTVANLAGAVRVSRAGQALVLNVSVTSANADKAARLANAVADAYVVDKLDARFEAAKRASAWLSDRLVSLKQQLRNSEEAVAQFRAVNDLVAAGGAQSLSLSQEQLGQLNGRLVAARADAAEKKARLDQMRKTASRGGDIVDLPGIAKAGAIPDLRRQENDLRRQEADLMARYSDRHPAVVNVRAQIADIRRSITVEANHLAEDVSHDFDLAVARQNAVEKALHEVTGQTDLDASKTITLRELERNATVDKTLFEDFLQRAKITEEQSTFETRDARLITPALPPGDQSSPKRNRVLLSALLMGLVAGVGGAYLIESLNAGFTTPRQLEEYLRLPLLASICLMRTQDLAHRAGVLTLPEYPIARPLSRFSEAVRTLRSGLLMSDVDRPPKVLMVTSTVPAEGKSTIAMTIAASSAQSGLKVLLVDADLRHSSASRYFQLDEHAGLVDYLVGDAELAKAIVYNNSLGLWVLPAGGKTHNPPDLLGSERFMSLMLALQMKFDVLVLDTPPMNPVVDALVVAQAADKVVFVVRWASTAREIVQHAIGRFADERKVAGVVFNYVVDAQARKYGGDAHAYKEYYQE